MAELTYRITAQGPLALNERKPGGSQYQESYEVIPGAVIRGALAALLLPECQDRFNQADHAACPRPALCRAILADGAGFRNAIPSGPTSAHTSLLPATAFTCKDHGGFANPAVADLTSRGHGIFDTLIDRAVWEAVAPPALQYLPTCATCGGRTVATGGAYSTEQLAANTVSRHSRTVARELLTRVAINRRRAVAEDELLYAVSAVTERTLDPFVQATDPDAPLVRRFPPTTFVGSIWLPEQKDSGNNGAGNDITAVKEQLKQLLKTIRHLGSGHTRGLGRVTIENVDPAATPSLNERIEAFQRKLHERTAMWGGEWPAKGTFALTLHSDAILSQDGWTPTMQLTPELLWRACSAQGNQPDLQLVRAYTTPITRGGWNGMQGLRKATATCVQAGAVYLYTTADLAPWLPRLAQVEGTGVGDRRAEGFGQVRVCDEIHSIAVGSVL